MIIWARGHKLIFNLSSSDSGLSSIAASSSSALSGTIAEAGLFMPQAGFLRIALALLLGLALGADLGADFGAELGADSGVALGADLGAALALLCLPWVYLGLHCPSWISLHPCHSSSHPAAPPQGHPQQSSAGLAGHSLCALCNWKCSYAWAVWANTGLRQHGTERYKLPCSHK